MKMRNDNNSPKTSHKGMFLCSLLCSLLVLACSHPYNASHYPDGMGALSLSVTVDAARSIVPLPADKPVPEKYVLKFTCTDTPEILPDIERNASELNNPIYLKEGNYHLAVVAYITVNGDDKPIAKGEDDLTITAGQSTDKEIILEAIINEGVGTFSWDIKFPGEVASAAMTIESLGGGSTHEEYNLLGAASPNSKTGSAELPVGYYSVTVTLNKPGAKPITHFEVLHIYGNMKSHFKFEFEDKHFNSIQYTVSFDYNDGVNTPAPQTVYYFGYAPTPADETDGKVSPPTPDPTRDFEPGLYFGTPAAPAFDGWYSGDVAWNFNDIVLGDMTLVAQWERDSSLIDISGMSGANDVEKAIAYVNNAANAAGAYTLLVDTSASIADQDLSRSGTTLALQGLEDMQTITGSLAVTGGAGLILGENITVSSVTVNSGSSVTLSENAAMGTLSLNATSGTMPGIYIGSVWTGSATLNLTGSGNIEEIISSWEGQPVLQGGGVNAGTVALFTLGDFISGIDTQPIADTHKIETTGTDMGKLVGLEGTAKNPFEVFDVDTLSYVGRGGDNPPGYEDWTLDKYYLQIANIDLIGVTWTPIGDYFANPQKNFTGTFDGGYCIISNLSITNSRQSQGLFGSIGAGGTVKNLGLRDCAISAYAHVGCVAGVNGGGTIENCYATGSVSNTGNSIGGIAGSNYGTIRNCYSTVTVKARGSGSDIGRYVGGIAGESSILPIQNCYSTGSVSANQDAGGIGFGGNFSNCVALNPGVSINLGANSGRVSSQPGADYQLSNNYGRSDMAIPTWVSINATATGKDGASITSDEWKLQSWWENTAKFDPDVWDCTVVDGVNLPILIGFKDDQNPQVLPLPGIPVTFSIEFDQILDETFTINGMSGSPITISIAGAGSVILTLTNSDDYDSFSWRVDGYTLSEYPFVNLTATDSRYSGVGVHSLTLRVVKDGWPYSKVIPFRVVD